MAVLQKSRRTGESSRRNTRPGVFTLKITRLGEMANGKGGVQNEHPTGCFASSNGELSDTLILWAKFAIFGPLV